MKDFMKEIFPQLLSIVVVICIFSYIFGRWGNEIVENAKKPISQMNLGDIVLLIGIHALLSRSDKK